MNWLYKYWAKTGGLIALTILIYINFSGEFRFLSLEYICWLNLAALMLHQFEEYVYPGGFMDFFNSNIYNPNGIIKFRINDKGAFLVNVITGWGAYLVGAVIGAKYPVYLMILLAINFVNGAAHTGALIKLRKYNPGFITGLFLFVPLSIYSAVTFINHGIIDKGSWLVIIAGTIIGILIIPFTLYLAKNNKSELMGENKEDKSLSH